MILNFLKKQSVILALDSKWIVLYKYPRNMDLVTEAWSMSREVTSFHFPNYRIYSKQMIYGNVFIFWWLF